MNWQFEMILTELEQSLIMTSVSDRDSRQFINFVLVIGAGSFNDRYYQRSNLNKCNGRATIVIRLSKLITMFNGRVK